MQQRPATQSRAIGAAFVVFGVLFALVMFQLLLAPDGLRKTRELRGAVTQTRSEIALLEQRNAALAGEVRNLKHGLEAAEERARADLGMIGKTESFYQIVDAGADGS